MSEKPQSFSDFYTSIRSHYSQNSWDYEKFKHCATNRCKIEYLLGQTAVQDALATLTSRNTQMPLCSIFGPPSKSKEEKISRKFPAPLITGSNVRYPQLSKKIEVKVTKKKGRMLVAKEKIDPGEVLIHEKPFCVILYSEFRRTHCNSCFKRLQEEEEVLSCPHCKQVNYCSEECRSSDFDWFHWAECGLLDRLQDESLGRLALLVYRLVVKSGLQTCIDTHDADLALTEKNCIYDSEDYACAFLQESHEDQRDPGDPFKRIAISLYLTHHLKVCGFFPPDLSNLTSKDFFSVENKSAVTIVTLLLRHLQSSSCNAYEIDELVRSQHQPIPVSHNIGGAVYATVSLSNHSCAPNTIRNSDGTTCILRAICTIRKGEEINDNYGFSYQIRPKEERQETLSQHYFFTCDCPACKQQWPLFHGKIQGRATTFVCSGCQRPLTPKEVEKLKKCPKCKKELKLGKVVRTLNNLGNDVNLARQTILDGKEVDENLLSRFLEYLKLMEYNVQHPCAEFIQVQHIVTQFYGLKANFSVVK